MKSQASTHKVYACKVLAQLVMPVDKWKQMATNESYDNM